MEEITVRKLNLEGQETWRWRGRVLIERRPDSVVIEARFNRPDLDFHGVLFGEGDRFVEVYYSDRWYNIVEIHAREDDALRGWYCNVTRPAAIGEGTIAYVDLALDLLVYPDGRQLVLDEDEFEQLPLEPEERARALTALGELQALFTGGNVSLAN